MTNNDSNSSPALKIHFVCPQMLHAYCALNISIASLFLSKRRNCNWIANVPVTRTGDHKIKKQCPKLHIVLQIQWSNVNLYEFFGVERGVTWLEHTTFPCHITCLRALNDITAWHFPKNLSQFSSEFTITVSLHLSEKLFPLNAPSHCQKSKT